MRESRQASQSSFAHEYGGEPIRVASAGPRDAVDELRDLVLALRRELNERTSVEPEFVTVACAAEVLGIGVKALRGAIQRKELRVFHLGAASHGRPRVCVAEVREWALSTEFDPYEESRRRGEATARVLSGTNNNPNRRSKS